MAPLAACDTVMLVTVPPQVKVKVAVLAEPELTAKVTTDEPLPEPDPVPIVTQSAPVDFVSVHPAEELSVIVKVWEPPDALTCDKVVGLIEPDAGLLPACVTVKVFEPP